MRNIFYITFFGILLVLAIITCEKEKDPPNLNLVYILNTTMVKDNWKIIQYHESGKDERPRVI